jgi:UDP-N-acetyl-D-mannosaminuronic acid dehydrogenase
MICDKLEINVWELIKLANHHPRVNILNPGPGVGGHCIAVDPWFIVDAAPQQARLIKMAREVNDSKIDFVVAKVKEAAKKFKNPKIACLGLSYKPDIDDLRESPALRIVENLLKSQTGQILVVEPHLRKIPKSLENLENLALVDLDDALSKCDIILVFVNHKKFGRINNNFLKKKIVLDVVGMFNGF